MAEPNEKALELALAAADAIVAEGTSDDPSGYGPPYKGPWFIIDKSSAEPEVNWPGELIEEINDIAKVSPALTRAKVAAMSAVLHASEPDAVAVERLSHSLIDPPWSHAVSDVEEILRGVLPLEGITELSRTIVSAIGVRVIRARSQP